MGYENEWEQTYALDKDPVRKYMIYPLIEKMVDDLNQKIILDAGCGNGNLLYKLKKYNFKEATGIDISKIFLEKASKYFNDDRIKFEYGDLTKKLVFNDNSFDVIFSIFVLNELPEIDALIMEFNRILSNSGYIILIMIHPVYAYHEYLFEKFTGLPNNKFVGCKGYFYKDKVDYKFTLSKGVAPHYQYTFENIINACSNAKLSIDKFYELKVDVEEILKYPEYMKTRDVPKFLAIKLKKSKPTALITQSPES